MTRIILSGCNGKMGRVISGLAEDRDDCRIVAGIDLYGDGTGAYPVFRSTEQVDVEGDVLIDFSNPSLLTSLLHFGMRTETGLVLCTTGYDKPQVAALTDTSKSVPVFYSGNMSLGVNLLIELAKKAAQFLGPGFDVEIVEKHHNQKLDAPSGTALMIADGISHARGASRYVYDRHSQRKKREREEIGIHSVRGGTIVGEHEVIFAGHQEVITLSHSAQSKEIFANGSINAALFLNGKPAGLYAMPDLLK